MIVGALWLHHVNGNCSADTLGAQYSNGKKKWVLPLLERGDYYCKTDVL